VLAGRQALTGCVAAQRAGRLHDRGWSVPATGVGWALALVSFGVAAAAGRSVVLLVVAVVLLDVAIQSLNILNFTRLFAVAGDACSRVNTATITANFLAGAAGSAAAGLLWSAGGWGRGEPGRCRALGVRAGRVGGRTARTPAHHHTQSLVTAAHRPLA